MASTSALRTQKTTSAQANAGQAWGDLEAHAEVILTALSGLTLGASDAAANAGSTASKAIFVQGGTGGLAVAVKSADGDQATIGVTTGAAIVTDVAGTVQRYLRGLVKLLGVSGASIATSAALGDGQGSVSALLLSPAGSNSSALLGTLGMGYNGASWDRLRIASVSKDLSAVTITTITTAWTPTTGTKFRLMGGQISVSAAMNVLFEDNAAGAGNFIFRTPKLLVDTPYNFVVLGGQGQLSVAANNVLKVTGSAAGAITGTLYGTEE